MIIWATIILLFLISLIGYIIFYHYSNSRTIFNYENLSDKSSIMDKSNPSYNNKMDKNNQSQYQKGQEKIKKINQTKKKDTATLKRDALIAECIASHHTASIPIIIWCNIFP